MQPTRPLADIIGRDQFVSGYDIDFEDESGAQAEAAELETESAEADAERQGEDRGYRQAEQRGGDQRSEWRGEDRNGGDRTQSDRTQGDRQARPQRDDRFRDDRPRSGRDDRPRYERQDRGERTDQRDARPPYRAESSEARPAEVVPSDTPVLRADDGEVSHAPAFLQVREPRDEASGEVRRPRRRRAPRDFEAGETPPAGVDADEG
jgi:hypothetical protein